jgi:hypothetical protein
MQKKRSQNLIGLVEGLNWDMGALPLLEEWKMKKVVGCLVVGALALAVTASAAPRPTNDADARGKDTGTVRTETAQLVTGAPEQLQAVATDAPATSIIRLIPKPLADVAALTGGVGVYPAGTTISPINQLNLGSTGPVRVWIDHEVGLWGAKAGRADPGTVQSKIDASGLMDSDAPGDQPDITYPVIPCASNPICRTTFGELWARCDTTALPPICDNSYVDGLGAHPRSYCFDFGPGSCSQGTCAVAALNVACFALTTAPRPDPGFIMYYATTVLDVPAGAKGKYTVNLIQAESFLSGGGNPILDIPTLSETGFVINIQTSACCNQIGTPAVNCIEALTEDECNALPVPFWVQPPGSPCPAVCIECVDDAMCDDGDSCTTERCNASGLCDRSLDLSWDPVNECCDGSGAQPVTAAIDDGDPCTADACSAGPVPPNAPPDSSNGSPTHTIVPGAACDDDNPCSFADACLADGSCQGTNVNGQPCPGGDVDCQFGGQTPGAVCDLAVDPDSCFCTLTPVITPVVVGGSGKPNPNCFDEGQKVSVAVHVAAAADPINGGQFLINYDPSCLSLNDVAGVAPYSAIVPPTLGNGSIFIAVGVNKLAGLNGPPGNYDMVLMSFDRIGSCNKCDICFGNNNPQNTYLVDNTGQRVGVIPECSKLLLINGELVLDTPDNVETNVDCDQNTAVVNWAKPSASASCGSVNLTCRGAYEDGTPLNALINGGGLFPIGASSFCCYAEAKSNCRESAGCNGPAVKCAPPGVKPEGCWTVTVNDETSLDIQVQLEPPIANSGELERCIKFCLYENSFTAPTCFSTDVVFGGLFNFVGKVKDKVKVPGSGKWDCISAEDQNHTLRSCYLFDPDGEDCVDGQLSARFDGDPAFGGNWLIGGNLDGWKKSISTANPSLYTIDILDFGTFLPQYGQIGDPNTPCPLTAADADINGDGAVTQADYSFIIKNFLVTQKECCGVVLPAGPGVGLTEISVDQLRQMGEADMAAADLNGDGLLNQADMDAFMQGVRPTKVNGNRGGKGLRSGR